MFGEMHENCVIVLLRFDQPLSKAQLEKLYPNRKAKVEGVKEYFAPEEATEMAYCLLKPNLLLAANESDMLRIFKSGGADSPLIRHLKTMKPNQPLSVVLSVSSARDLFPGGEVPPPMDMVLKTAQQIDLLELNFASSNLAAALDIHCQNTAGANQTLGLLNMLKGLAVVGLEQQKEQLKQLPPAKRKEFETAMQTVESALDQMKPEVASTHVTAQLDGPTSTALVSMAADAYAGFTLTFRNISRTFGADNNLRQLLLAMHSYEVTHRKLPAAYMADKNGKPLLSWRVALLPYLDQQALYNQFHLDEAWDSPHNQKLIAKMPSVYSFDGSRLIKTGKTTYLGFRGANTVLGERPISIAQVPDGTSNTVMLVDVPEEKAVIWTQPDDFTFNPKDPLQGLLKPGQDRLKCGFVDGSVKNISTDLKDETFLHLFLINDGQVISLPDE